jgi:erythronate-4-phosphate dehydrogenase
MCAVEDIFSAIGDVELADGRAINSDLLDGVDVLLVRSVTQVDATLLRDHRLRFVGSATSGIDHVNREALEQRDIAFAWAGGSNADSVVDYVFSAICQSGDKLERLLAGAELGIVGYGHVGRALQRRLEALEINCKAVDPWLAVDASKHLTTLEEVLECEVICLHAALTDELPWPSRHLLGKRELERLPQDCLLINAGRGELIDSEALLAQLRGDSGPTVILDVWEGEPQVEEELLARCRFGTAHIAGYSYDAKLRATEMLYRSLCAELNLALFETAATEQLVPVHVPPELAGAGLLRYLVAQAYNIAEDDQLLRQGLSQGFDGLRKNYRKRRELSLLNIENVDQLSAATLEMAAALGCRLDSC